MDIEAARRDGYSDAEIADELARRTKFDIAKARADGYGDDEIMGELQRRQGAALSKMDVQPGGIGQRFARGVAEPFVGGAQLVMKGLGALGAVSPEAVQTQQDFTKEFVGKSDALAPEGIDWARLGGNAAPLALAGGASAPSTVLGLARSGAILGGVGGLTTPVAGDDFAGTKAMQTIGGTVGGAVLTPVASKVVGALGRGLASGINAIRRLGPKASLQDIRISITNHLQAGGVDVTQLPAAWLDDVTAQVHRATGAGASLDADSLVNQALYRLVGDEGTLGQVTQNPAQYGREMFLRNAPGGERLATQYQGVLGHLNQRLADLQRGAAPPTQPVNAGQQIMGTLRQADERGRGLVRDLYQQATREIGQDAPLNAPQLANGIYSEIEREVAAPLPGEIAGALNRFSSGGALDVNAAQPLIKAINRAYDGAKPDVRYSLDIARRHVNEALQGIADDTGRQAAQSYRTATQAAAQRFGVHDAIPALRAVVHQEVEPDDFMQKFVYNAPREDFTRLAGFLRQASPNSWQQVRGQVIADLRQAAQPGSSADSFSQASYNRALRSLDRDGKLETLFNPEELQMLRAVGRVGELHQVGPAGVSRTGLGGAAQALGMLSRLAGKLPLFRQVAPVADAIITRGQTELESNAALQGRAPVVNALTTVIPQSIANRAAYGATGVPLAFEWDQRDPRGTAREVRR